jgi:alanine-glyoxylate transaminase/serine-glyoxylate transaminase/serine-pyruvate transaminase
MTKIPNLSHGRSYLAIPGPSVMPDAVLRAMHRGAPNIYAGELPDMMPGLVADLCRVARTTQNLAIYIGNGHAAWEAALSNAIAQGDRILVASTGRFAHGWAEMARGVGGNPEIIEFGPKSPIDAQRIEDCLRADKAHEIKAVMAVHVDTSTSILSDIMALRRAMDAAGHPALLMVDCIASLGCDVFEMDSWGVDVMVAASQKGLMVPPGMGFVFFSDKAASVRRSMGRVSAYWDWEPRANPAEFYQYWCGTAPTHHLYGLRAALDLIHEETIEQVWARHAHLARAIWAACETWSEQGSLRLNVPIAQHRSTAVTALAMDAPLATRLRTWCEQEMGLTLGIGLGWAAPNDPAWHGHFRLGHMGHVSGTMILGLLSSIEAGFLALDIPHGAGGAAVAARAMAGR